MENIFEITKRAIQLFNNCPCANASNVFYTFCANVVCGRPQKRHWERQTKRSKQALLLFSNRVVGWSVAFEFIGTVGVEIRPESSPVIGVSDRDEMEARGTCKISIFGVYV